MDVGVGYPGMFPDIDRELLLSWARHAEEAGFDSLSTGERLACDCNDLIVSMAMVGAVTERIRLMSTVMVLPAHQRGWIAKQVASLDFLTGGRFTLGVGIGGRTDDFEVAPADYRRRTTEFEEQLDFMKRMWRREPREGETQIGPAPHTPGGPRVLVGPTTPKAARRAALVDGIATYGSPDPAMHVRLYESAVEAWEEAGREGKPYFAAGMYFALGPDAEAKSREYMHWYYSYMEPADVDRLLERVTLPADSVKETVKAFEDAGVDDFYLCPLIAEEDQIDRLVDEL